VRQPLGQPHAARSAPCGRRAPETLASPSWRHCARRPSSLFFLGGLAASPPSPPAPCPPSPRAASPPVRPRRPSCRCCWCLRLGCSALAVPPWLTLLSSDGRFGKYVRHVFFVCWSMCMLLGGWEGLLIGGLFACVNISIYTFVSLRAQRASILHRVRRARRRLPRQLVKNALLLPGAFLQKGYIPSPRQA